jgi:hypothetical protein
MWDLPDSQLTISPFLRTWLVWRILPLIWHILPNDQNQKIGICSCIRRRCIGLDVRLGLLDSARNDWVFLSDRGRENACRRKLESYGGSPVCARAVFLFFPDECRTPGRRMAGRFIANKNCCASI